MSECCPQRIHFDIRVGKYQATDYAQVAQKEKLSKLQLRVRQLRDQVDQIVKEQIYQRYREERFRATIESTNQRIFWWSISQLVVLFSIGFWQMKQFKRRIKWMRIFTLYDAVVSA